MISSALALYAGSAARRHIASCGLHPQDVGIVPAAAGGPKGLILGPLDRFIFSRWLPQSGQPIDLVGASIGAWRMAAACMPDAQAAFQALETGYIHGEMKPPPGRKRPTPEQVSATFAHNLREMFEGHVASLLAHPRYRLHVLASRGRHLLRREGRWRTPAGYLGAALANAACRRAMGAFIERVVFSRADAEGRPCAMPFDARDYPTRHALLTPDNFYAVLQASGSIPFMLRAVHDIPGAPSGAYWDGGITDYHLHLAYRSRCRVEGAGAVPPAGPGPLVLYPHFQRTVVPGWLDKALKWRHRSSAFLDHMLVLAPHPDWVRTLPGAKLPDRNDFRHLDSDARVAAWTRSVQAARQLADEFEQWLARPDVAQIQPL